MPLLIAATSALLIITATTYTAHKTGVAYRTPGHTTLATLTLASIMLVHAETILTFHTTTLPIAVMWLVIIGTSILAVVLAGTITFRTRKHRTRNTKNIIVTEFMLATVAITTLITIAKFTLNSSAQDPLTQTVFVFVWLPTTILIVITPIMLIAGSGTPTKTLLLRTLFYAMLATSALYLIGDTQQPIIIALLLALSIALSATTATQTTLRNASPSTPSSTI